MTEGAVVLKDKELTALLMNALRPAGGRIPIAQLSTAGRHLGAARISWRSRWKLVTSTAGARNCERAHLRPEVALIQLQLAELLLDHCPDKRDTAIAHLDFAIAEFQSMKMQPSLERALGHRGLLKA